MMRLRTNGRSLWTLLVGLLVFFALAVVVVDSGRANDPPVDNRKKHAPKSAKALPKSTVPKGPAAKGPTAKSIAAKSSAGKNAAAKTIDAAKSPAGKNAAAKTIDAKTIAAKSPAGKNAAAKTIDAKSIAAKSPAGKNAAAKTIADKAKAPGQPAGARIGANRIGPGASPKASLVLQQARLQRQNAIRVAQSRLPYRPLPGERGFTGVPARGETRFISNEMVFHVASNVSPQTVESVARRFNLTAVGSQDFSLAGGTLFHFRIADGRPVADVIRALEAENIGTAQPNYVFSLQEDASLAAVSAEGDPSQYVVSKLRLSEVHRIAKGSDVLVAVIDSKIDVKHPDLANAIVEQFDAVGRDEKPDAHGTGMAGAIAAHSRLVGVAPGARILAIRAFSPGSKSSAEATTEHIIKGIDWAIKKGARIINMSFAGPYDPMLQLALKKAHDSGVVLIAAAGNLGPKSPPLYPAADPNVIAVTATDENDKLLAQANRGPHVAIAAPGVDILEPAPDATYQVTTGTSVAAAHVSGVAALIFEHNPGIDAATVLDILVASAKTLGPKGRDDQFGWGLVDPYRALTFLDTQVAQDRPVSARPVPASAKPGPVSAR